ncbi:MAG: TraB/GumN family protein [Neisseriaceae bacterium]
MISKEGEPTSYLLGSLHFGKANDQLPLNIQQIIQQVDYVYTEVKIPVDLVHPKDPDFKSFIAKVYDKNTSPLSSKIGLERFNKIRAMLQTLAQKKRLRYDTRSLEHMQLWFLPLYLPQIIVENSFNPEKGLDQLVLAEARKLKKTLGALEEHMFRYHILKDKPIYLIMNDIDQILNNPTLAEWSMRSIYELYHSNTGFEIIGMSLNPERSILGFLQGKKNLQSANWLRKELLEKRNLHWVPKILALLPHQKTLFVVGLLHLYGPTGLVQQLKNKGYTLTPLSPSQTVYP